MVHHPGGALGLFLAIRIEQTRLDCSTGDVKYRRFVLDRRGLAGGCLSCRMGMLARPCRRAGENTQPIGRCLLEHATMFLMRGTGWIPGLSSVFLALGLFTPAQAAAP